MKAQFLDIELLPVGTKFFCKSIYTRRYKDGKAMFMKYSIGGVDYKLPLLLLNSSAYNLLATIVRIDGDNYHYIRKGHNYKIELAERRVDNSDMIDPAMVIVYKLSEIK